MASQTDQEDVFLEFVDTVIALDTREEVFLGIDPGASGAIALLCGNAYTVVDIPVIKTAVKRAKKLKAKEARATGKKTKTIDGETTMFNFNAIVDLFRVLNPLKHRLVIGLEEGQVQNNSKGKFKPTPLTAYKVGIGYGMWHLYFASRGWPLTVIKPAAWKKLAGLQGKDKEAARIKALAKWPRAPLTRKSDHNRAEALLLAQHLKQLSGTKEP